uniref:NADH dehydrogenase subunit 6 n=1 Tax=Phoronis psammophila TaxID=67897 RepID=Q6UKF3_9BILA|nr:NADH dehydrogenase subunit 6 [Phoronis architecta]
MNMRMLLFLGVVSVSMYMYMTRPLSLGALIMLTSLALTVILGLTINSWWGLILFLVYVGALLVLFVYVMAMSPNCFFSRPKKLTALSMMLMVLMMVSFSLILLFPKVEFKPYSASFLELQKPLLLDSFYNMTCLISLSVVLLIAMIAVVYLLPGKNQGAPLRPFN